MIEFKYEDVEAGGNKIEVIMRIHSESSYCTEVANIFKRFSVAIGYHPSTVDRYIKEDDGDWFDKNDKLDDNYKYGGSEE